MGLRKKIKVEDAVGMVLAHDMTRITRGEFKGVAFRRGHIVQKADIPELLRIGTHYLYVLDLGPGELHEDDAAHRIAAAISAPDLEFTEPREGKINIITPKPGLLKINVDGLLAINTMDDIIVATLKDNFPCKKGQVVAATRIITLTIGADQIDALEKMLRQAETILRVKPFRPLKVGAVVTGSEVYDGLIADDFDPSIGKKIIEAGCTLERKILVPDNVERIRDAILELKDLGCEMIITTGGLSVDPDDVTRQGVRMTGAQETFYGSPVLPGAMLMISVLEETPVISVPACVFYHKRTVFDLVFPRVLAGETIRKEDIAAMGHGGLCMNCDVCHYPVCSFGR